MNRFYKKPKKETIQKRQLEFSKKYTQEITWLENNQIAQKDNFLKDMLNVLKSGERPFSEKMHIAVRKAMSNPRFDIKTNIELKGKIDAIKQKVEVLVDLVRSVDEHKGEYYVQNYSAIHFVRSIQNQLESGRYLSKKQLQGLNKEETVKRHGKDQVLIWRRSYDTQPPMMNQEDYLEFTKEARCANIPTSDLPKTESLKDTVTRFMPYWEETIVPELRHGKSVLICAHGNSLRALVKHLDSISDQDITRVNIPTGIPLVYELNENLKTINHYYLGDPEEAKKAAEAVAHQTESKL